MKIRKIKLENKNKNLYILPDGKTENEIKFQNLVNKYKKGYTGKKYSQQKYKEKLKLLQDIKKINNKEFTFNKISFLIKEKEEFNKTLNTLQNYLKLYNIHFLHTTIEEILISTKSKKLFFKWLKTHYEIEVEKIIYKTIVLKSSRHIYKKRIKIGKIIIKKQQVPMKLLSKKSRKYITLELIIEYFRLLFDGKMELLITYKNIIDKNNKNFQAKKLLNFLEKSLKKQSKTSGWTTKFLDFAINEIEEKRDNKPFKDEFKIYFEELYDIITYIEKKL